MWLTLLGGLAWLGRLAIPLLRNWQPWAGMLLATLLFTLTMLGIEFASYIGMGGEKDHLIQFSIYKLAIWTDWPLLQLILCCAVNLSLARFWPKPGKSIDTALAQQELEVI